MRDRARPRGRRCATVRRGHRRRRGRLGNERDGRARWLVPGRAGRWTSRHARRHAPTPTSRRDGADGSAGGAIVADRCRRRQRRVAARPAGGAWWPTTPPSTPTATWWSSPAASRSPRSSAADGRRRWTRERGRRSARAAGYALPGAVQQIVLDDCRLFLSLAPELRLSPRGDRQPAPADFPTGRADRRLADRLAGLVVRRRPISRRSHHASHDHDRPDHVADRPACRVPIAGCAAGWRRPARTSKSAPSWKVKTRWILGGWAVLSAVSALGTALTPALLAFPMVLVAFTPRLPFLILAATSANPVLFFCVAVPRMLVADPIHIALGRRYGRRFVPRRAQRVMQRLGLFGVALRPTSKVLAAAGACKMRTSRVLDRRRPRHHRPARHDLRHHGLGHRSLTASPIPGTRNRAFALELFRTLVDILDLAPPRLGLRQRVSRHAAPVDFPTGRAGSAPRSAGLPGRSARPISGRSSHAQRNRPHPSHRPRPRPARWASAADDQSPLDPRPSAALAGLSMLSIASATAPAAATGDPIHMTIGRR